MQPGIVFVIVVRQRKNKKSPFLDMGMRADYEKHEGGRV